MDDDAIRELVHTLLYRCLTAPYTPPPESGEPCALLMTETAESVRARVKYAINKIVCHANGRIPFVIAHGGTIREFARQWGIGNTKMQNMGMIGIVVKDGKPEAFNLVVPLLQRQATRVANHEAVVAQRSKPNRTLESQNLSDFLARFSEPQESNRHVFVLMRHALSSNNFLSSSPKKLRQEGIEPTGSKYALALSKTVPMLGQDAKLMMTEEEKNKGKNVGSVCKRYATKLQFFVSPMLRTLQTFALIAHGMEDSENRLLPHTPSSFFRPFKPRFRELCDLDLPGDPILTFDAFKQAGDLADGGFKGLKKPRSFALYEQHTNDDYLLRYGKKEGEKDICKGVVRLDVYDKDMLFSILKLLEENTNETFPLFSTQPNLWITGPVTNVQKNGLTNVTKQTDSPTNVPAVMVVEELQEVRKSVSDDIKRSRSVSDLNLEQILDNETPPRSFKPILYYVFVGQTRDARRCTSGVDTNRAASVLIGLHRRQGTILTDAQIEIIMNDYPNIHLDTVPTNLDELMDDRKLIGEIVKDVARNFETNRQKDVALRLVKYSCPYYISLPSPLDGEHLRLHVFSQGCDGVFGHDDLQNDKEQGLYLRHCVIVAAYMFTFEACSSSLQLIQSFFRCFRDSRNARSAYLNILRNDALFKEHVPNEDGWKELCAFLASYDKTLSKFFEVDVKDLEAQSTIYEKKVRCSRDSGGDVETAWIPEADKMFNGA